MWQLLAALGLGAFVVWALWGGSRPADSSAPTRLYIPPDH